MKLKYEEYGDSTKPSLVLLHGWGLCGKVFNPILDNLSENYHVIIQDLPGYGCNYNIPANHTIGILKSLEETLPQCCTIIGWSLGGMIAQKYCISNPNRVNALITISSSPKFISDVESNWSGTDPVLLENLASKLTDKNYDSVIEKFLTLQAMGSPTVKNDIKKIKELLHDSPTARYYELRYGLKLLADLDLRGYISRIECPSLHLYGKKDRLVPAMYSNCWPKKDDTYCYTFEKSSHAPFISEPEHFLEIVNQFLNKHVKR